MPTQVIYQEEQQASVLPQEAQPAQQSTSYYNSTMMRMQQSPCRNNQMFHPMTTAGPFVASTAMPPVLTLTLGDVNFSLTPTDANSAVTFQGMKPTEVVLNLQAFTGKLSVSMRSSPLSLPAQAMSLPAQTMTVQEDGSQQQQAPPPFLRQVSPHQPLASRNLHYQLSDPALATSNKMEKRKKKSQSSKSSRKKRKSNDSVEIPSNPSTSEKPETATTKTLANTLPTSGALAAAVVVESPQSQDTKIQEISGAAAAQDSKDATAIAACTFSDAMDVSLAPPKEPAVLESTSIEKSETPCPRWGHTMTVVNNQRVLVYGGQTIDPMTNRPKTLNDLHIFDFEKQRWIKSVKFGDDKRQWARQWHTATYLSKRKLLVCFGGESVHPKSGNVTISHKTMVLDTEIMLWYPPSVSGETPSGRSGHSTTFLEATDELVVFGGVKGSKWLNTVSVLDTSTWTWRTPTLEGTPPLARSYHTATAILANDSTGSTQRIVIFGGNGKMESFNTVHVLERQQDSWRWSHPTVTGEGPKPRTGHSATLLGDGTICIYGGWDPTVDDYCEASKTEEVLFQDSFLLDTETWSWRQGPKPERAEARVGHAAVLNQAKDGTEILIFGGRVKNDRFATGFQTLNVP